MHESEQVEFKQQYVDDIKKEIIGFANTKGGTIHIGIADDGQVIGVDDPDLIIQRIANTVRDAIRPDLSMFIRYEVKRMDSDKQVVSVEVQIGTHRPYYLASKGLRPEGVYVRQGTTTAPASETFIRAMIRETDGDNYEDMRALNQNLTFEYAKEFFGRQKVAFDEVKMASLGMLSLDGIYSNLGYLLSDQCPHIIKGATFAGTDQVEFQDRREFSGSLLQQLSDTYEYISLRNQKHASFQGLYREDHMDYPEVALREALLNAIVHRDYSFSAHTLLSIYSDRIEIVSAGGLAHGISMEDISLGFSVCRNPKLANVFYRLNLIEAYGTGMMKMLSSYQKCSRKPMLTAKPNAFKVVLPNANVANQEAMQREVQNVDGAEGLVLSLARNHGTITRADVEAHLGIKTAVAVRLLKRMVDEHLLVRIGKGPKTRYASKEYE